MRIRKIWAFLVCLALSSVSSFASEGDYYSYSYARLSYVKGDVFIQRAEDLGYEEGVVNLAMIAGDKLGTRDGRAEIHFGKRNYLRVDKDTQIDLAELPQRGFDLIKLHLLSGNIFLRIRYLEREKDFEIHTPDASFYVLEEGLYQWIVKSDHESELRVFEGTAEAAGEAGSVLVNSDESIVVTDGRFLSEPEYFYAGYTDSFYEWNKSRDALYSRYVARNYLPEEIDEYEAELDYYGDWVYENSYGYVWVPRVHHSTWRPYWNGRWVWYPIIGWNWVSYEPWGWCVSHYGRWHWRLGLGWYWIPTRYWGPAWVHWYHGTHYCAWSPLSYYGYPGVIINNHYYARYRHHTFPVHSRTLVAVHKNQLQARHISRAALRGNQVNRLGKISLSSRQPNVRPAISRSGAIHSKATRTLSRSNVRRIANTYASGRTVDSRSRIGSSRVRSTSTSTSRSGSVRRGVSSSRQSGARVSSRSSSRSSSIPGNRSIGSANPSRSSRSNSTIRTYPSRRQSTSSRGRAASRRSSETDKKARVTTRSSAKQGQTYVPGRSIKYYRSRNSSQSSRESIRDSASKRASSKESSRSSAPKSQGSKAKTTRSKEGNSAKQYSSQMSVSTSKYRSSRSSNASATRSTSSRSTSRSSANRSKRNYPSSTSALSRSYSRSRTPTRKYSAPSRSSGRSSYSRIARSSPKSYSKSGQTGRVKSSSPSRSSGRKSSSSSRSSTRTRKK